MRVTSARSGMKGKWKRATNCIGGLEEEEQGLQDLCMVLERYPWEQIIAK